MLILISSDKIQFVSDLDWLFDDLIICGLTPFFFSKINLCLTQTLTDKKICDRINKFIYLFKIDLYVFFFCINSFSAKNDGNLNFLFVIIFYRKIKFFALLNTNCWNARIIAKKSSFEVVLKSFWTEFFCPSKKKFKKCYRLNPLTWMKLDFYQSCRYFSLSQQY